jgi:hypothetical protein
MTDTRKKELQAASDYLMKAYGILRLMGDHHTKEVWSVIKSIESDIWWDETTAKQPMKINHEHERVG